jgi:hypothetical protein
MALLFGRRATAATAPEQALAAGVACRSHQPGHQMHYIQQGQALRSPAERAEEVVVAGDRVYLTLESGTHLDWRHHDPDRLRATLDRFPTSRIAYPRFHALRVGPYWFNCAPLDRFSPCPDPA